MKSNLNPPDFFLLAPNTPRFCQNCGCAFQPKKEFKGHRVKFCSRRCGGSEKRPVVQRSCETCGSYFFRAIKQYGRFCSKKCSLHVLSKTLGKKTTEFSLNHYPVSLDIAVSFLRKINIKSSSLCWDWLAAKNNKGYGLYTTDRRTMGSHRYSYFLHYGDFDKRKLVCHKCDNPSCVNPNHLFLGSHKDNIVDASEKGRLLKSLCKNGLHEKNEENTERRKRNGKIIRICKVCSNESRNKRYRKNHDVEGNRQKRDLFCKNNHARTKENTKFYRHKSRGKMVRECLVCLELSNKKRIERLRNKNAT